MIEINNLTKRKIDRGLFKKTAEIILKEEKKKIDLSVAFVGQSEIKDINKKYRDKNKPTDVLSFHYGDTAEIIICLEAIEKRDSFKKQVLMVFIHGVLHILGYNHENNKKEAEAMERKQDYYLLKMQKYGKK